MNHKYKVGMDEYILTPNEHRQVVEFIHARGKGLVVLRGGNLMFKVEAIRSVNLTDHEAEGQERVYLAPPPVLETPEQRKERGKGWTKLSEWAKKQLWWKEVHEKNRS